MLVLVPGDGGARGTRGRMEVGWLGARAEGAVQCGGVIIVRAGGADPFSGARHSREEDQLTG